ncbi:hypothetical protein F0U60_53040 [Archangium minus]|uniref:Uncharacterized protein n=1 Tax=Archangium minus TaxID=83450 RepID=A0ABY9X900_9BACT|nr:hypothetical protein F0U60_53040 [Archangium minus]
MTGEPVASPPFLGRARGQLRGEGHARGRDERRVFARGRVARGGDVNAIPDVAHHLSIQLDAFRTTLGAPVKMYVDWVKLYQR